MNMMKNLTLVFVVLACFFSVNGAFAADTFTISGTVTDISTSPNMIAIDEGDMVTEVYGIKFGYLERQYNIFIEIGTEVTVEAIEYVCYDGTVRLKATNITVGDATINLVSTTGSGRGRSM